MNERIKQLWDTAAKLETDPSWEGQTKFMEKFAESIINECARIADEKPPYVGCGYITKTKGMLIKEHFGVDYEL